MDQSQLQEPQGIPEGSADYLLTDRQELAYAALTSPEDANVLYGGAKGGGKSFLFCLWVYSWSRYLIDFFELKYDPKNPQPALAIGFIGRKVGAHFGSTTLETWKRTIPQGLYKLKSDKIGGNYILILGLVKVYYGGLDNQEKLEKFNSAEFAFIGVDQAEETERNDVQVLQATLRMTYKGKIPPYKELYTANPADCWLKEDFIDNARPNNHYIPALPSDNPHLPPSYVDRLKEKFRHNVALLKAYLEGDWAALKASNALISMAMINELKGITRHFKDVRRCVVCDPSLGGDECVIDVFENFKVVEQEILHNERNGMIVAGHMVRLGNKWRVNDYGADTTGGLGSVILDRVKELKPGARMHYINSSEAPDNPERATNIRGELWWDTMVLIQDKKVPYIEDEQTRNQLVASRFKLMNSDGQIQMEPKTETKKRSGGESPDRADAYNLGMRVMSRCDPIHTSDSWAADQGSRAVTAGAKSAMAA